MSEQRHVVSLAEAKRRIGRRKHIHTFIQGGFALIGADRDRDDLIRAMAEKGVEEAGAQAAAMGHTLVIVNYRDGMPLFIEAQPAKTTAKAEASR